MALRSILTLRQSEAGPDTLILGQARLAPAPVIPGPTVLPVLGFTRAPLLVTSDIGVLCGAWEPVSTIPGLAALPIAVGGLSLGAQLVVTGFRPSPITDEFEPHAQPLTL